MVLPQVAQPWAVIKAQQVQQRHSEVGVAVRVHGELDVSIGSCFTTPAIAAPACGSLSTLGWAWKIPQRWRTWL